MFIKVTQSGSRRYAQLVESFRNVEGKPRQRTVCALGRLEAGGEVDTQIASMLIRFIDKCLMSCYLFWHGSTRLSNVSA